MVTCCCSRETFALLTPGIFSSTFFTLLTQPMQVIPLIFITSVCILCLLWLVWLAEVIYYRSSVTKAQALARQRFNNRELLTTDTELIAIAAPAMTGLSRPIAASGIPSTL